MSEDNQSLSPEIEQAAQSFAVGEEEPLNTSFERDEGKKTEEEGTERVLSARKTSRKRRGADPILTDEFKAFKKSFDERAEGDAKLQLAIDFMEASLAQGGASHFRNFWEARRLCQSLFKENISPQLRNQLWTKYGELSKEARRLKEILDEQSAFAAEQIEIAVVALEKEIAQSLEPREQTVFPDAFVFPALLQKSFDIYHRLQAQLNIYNAQASRINALRKELLKTDMRVGQKNKFFQRLSTAGDSVFPKRKELIIEISQQFSQDVEGFIKQHFQGRTSNQPLFALREEIKNLQGLAKVLTLNTQTFTETRSHLSECWDQIKTEEKERKKDRAHQRVVFKQNAEEIEMQIKALEADLEKGEEPLPSLQKKAEEIAANMRKVELGRDEVKALRDSLGEARRQILERVKRDDASRQEKEKERNRHKRELFQTLKEQAQKLIACHDSKDGKALMNERDALQQLIDDSSLSKMEKTELERLLKPLRDIIAEKNENDLMALSDDDRQSLQQMQSILKQRKARRQEIKNQLEVLRKAAGSSGLDFEFAMTCNAQIQEEKERMEKANQAIEETEDKIRELQAKIRNAARAD